MSEAGVLKKTPGAVAENGPSLRILLVDDHYDTRMIMGRMLGMRGYQVTEAGSVQQALAAAREKEFDLLISDLGLPDGSGHDLMEKIRAERPLEGIVLSGYGADSDIEKSRAAGFRTHLTKPVDFIVLDEAIRKFRLRGPA